MHNEKKITKEDTWRPADLRRHIREGEQGDENVRRRDDSERKHRGGESLERRPRDPERESRRERDKHRESTRERRDVDRKERSFELSKHASQDRRGDKERDKERKKETDRLGDGDMYSDDNRDNGDKKREREDKHDREREKERHRDKEKDRVSDRERRNGEDRDKKREERDKERSREEYHREHRTERERRRHEESGDRVRDQRERHRERERPKDGREEKRNDKGRLAGRKHSEQKDESEYREEHRRLTEERERKQKERGYGDHKPKHDSESREHRDLKRSGEEERHHRGDRERAEWDKHKERKHREEGHQERKHRDRRHREEEDLERIHRDKGTSKKSASDKSHGHEINTVKTEVVNDLADQEYEDDFEDYEEDFEELDQSEDEGEDDKEPVLPQVGEEKEEVLSQKRKEIEAIQRAMDEENERVGSAQFSQSMRRGEEDGPKWSRGSEKNQSRDSHRGRFIDFVAAKQREVSKKVATKQKKRSTELLRLIDLDFSMKISLLDLPPVNEYDMYIRTFGTENTKQAYVQCNEDNADRDIQTEEIEVCEKWTQHPPEHNGACGDPNLSQEAREKNSEINYDSQRLAAFLHSASQVMVVLLEEDQAERKSLRKLRTQTDTLSFSDGSLQLNTKLPFLYGRQINLLHFSQVQMNTVMSVHTPTTKPSAVRLDSSTIICIWNIWEPSRPQKILVYESEVQCCCFSPGKAILVFAGTSVGSVVLWDLREHASNHCLLKIGEDEWCFRQPTFSTDAVMAGSGHFSSVSSVEVVPSTVAGGLRPEVPLLVSEEESSGLSFQLASLDDIGVLHFWVVVELPRANEAGSPTDLGLRPGGKVKLLHSSSLLTAERVSPGDAVKTGPLQARHLKFLPSDSNHFFIGTNMGLVSHGTSHGLKAAPKFYRFQEAEVQPIDVSSIHFSPFRQNLFLVGCSDGSIRLHAVSQEQPVAEWRNSTAGEPVISLQWAQTRPTVFCVLDAASNLHIWDLLKNDTEPVLTERISADRVTDMAVFGDSGKQNTYSGIALVHESGKIEMQYFKRNFTLLIPAEEVKLETLMTEAL
ncbi:putative WD repeat-containing protein 60-like [Scophthalmus maximus]|uniref:Putative WD repeat-containing protein 60-like n=1 Tax=Scophthalmus maximus TaxID=52904 RepID=A0A2U9CV28_SCOMX|nr:cytoplasmic dynein 2 intermediate chain 1 isoform X2 [Scophthalmus maximus]AWP20535.1 putative WD repeat-containing protein 60-like [Scophthalmus maximus]